MWRSARLETMPHWYSRHDLLTLRKMIKAQKTKAALTLVDELRKRLKKMHGFSKNKNAPEMKAIMSAAREKPERYTSNRLVSDLRERFR